MSTQHQNRRRFRLFNGSMIHWMIVPAAIAAASLVHAGPYAFPGPPVIAAPGPILPAPGRVIGKEFSHFTDRDMAGAPAPGQVVGWDGVGGTIDLTNFAGAFPAGINELQVDALSHRNDLMSDQLRGDDTYLLFSVGNSVSPIGTGTMVTTEGETIGFAGDVSYEAPGSIAKGVWASAPMIDSMTPVRDLDGLEIWGPEPPGTDADRFSLEDDAITGVSVWTDTGGAYISQSVIIGAVTSMLGMPASSNLDPRLIDLDALMSSGDDEDFAPGDSIIFSIRQIADPLDADGFYATGSEIFTLDYDATGLVPGFLAHGGHLWDHDYALAAMRDGASKRQLDLNALEAASVPEPSTAFLLTFGLLLIRRGRQLLG